ncbi:hypothetical protein CYMTET_38436 [Cymbomonas tetramitiformis]|uniref:Response regulatory domain-containing protein n=1 Tax=Cymbomonas tetramitiformis TaxID=36881 RepID=A0AAE0CDG4_9CHLO|nr:hypothetical protein CYMTET_38436 [Cymbomonas tetramitiformis]
MRWQGLCDKLRSALDVASHLSFLGRHVEERDDSEDEQNRLKFLELIHCNIPGAVFHLSIPWFENLGSARCIYCSVGSLRTFGIASSRLTSAGSNFVKVFTSIIDPQYKQDFLDRFAELEKSATGLEWKGKVLLPSTSSAPETPRWICVLIQPRAQTQSNATSGELQYVTATASLPWLAFVGCAWDCSAEQEAEELCIEKEMHQSDLHFFHFAQHSLAELLELVDLVQQELPVVHTDLLSRRPEDHDDGLPDDDGQLLKSLLEELKRVCQRGKEDCLMRPLLNLISDGGYQQAPQIVTGEQLVAYFAGECNIVAVPPSTELADAHIPIDLKVMYIVLSNLVSNALKYGSQEEKPQLSIKPLTSMDHDGSACHSVVLELWNAPGANHMDFLENSERILQTNCLPAHGGLLSDGIGMATIQMCLKCTEWWMQHKVDLDGTTFQICLPGAVALDVDVGPMPTCVDHNIQSGRNADEGGSNTGQRSEREEPHGKLPPGVRVAVLDDAVMLRTVYKQQLRKMGVRSFWVQGACEAEIFGFAKLVMENHVDIVVLDQNLSEVLGFEVGKYVDGCSIMCDLMSMGFNSVCVTRTAYHSSECKSKYLGHGFDDLLSKTDSFEQQLNTTWKHYRGLLLWRRTPILVGFGKMRFMQRAQAERFPAHSTCQLGSSPGKMKLDLPTQHSWESAYWEQTVPRGVRACWTHARIVAFVTTGLLLVAESTRGAAPQMFAYNGIALALSVLSYRAERQRRLDFLADQSSKLTAQPDGTNLGSTNADELIQSPLLLCFLSRPLELRFCAHKLLHAAASAATLAHHQHYTDEGVPAKHSETCWLLVMWLSQCTLVLCHGLDLQASPAASAAVPLAMVMLHWIHVSADICQRQPWYQIAACGLVPFVVHGVWGVASFTVLDADWAASTEAATAAPAQHRNYAAFQLWTFSYVIAAGISMALSMGAYVNEETARQDFLGVEEQRAAVDRAVQHEDVDATVTSDEGDIADRRELHGWQLHLPRHSWESAYWEQTVPRVLSYRAERQRRLDFLADQSSKLTAQPDGTNLGSTNADELIQSPLLLCFLSRPLELRFCAHKLLHAAASAATLAHHQHYTDEGVPAKHSETCWLLVMWLSQCTLVLCHGLDLQASPAASAAVPLAMVALHWIHVSADICQRQPWYQIAACGLVPFVVHGVWGVASFTVLDADWAASTEAATAAPAQHRNDAAFQLWTFSYVIAAGISMALSMGAYVNEETARQDFLGVEEQRAAVDRAVQHEDVDATVTSDEGDIADRRELHGWQLHLPRHSWESAYWEQTVPRGVRAWWTHARIVAFVTTGLLLVAESTRGAAPQMFAYNGIALALSVLSYRAERQRRLDFLADQSSKLTAQPDGTNLGSTNADELIQSPLLLCFLSRPLELRFCAHKLLHAAASAATLAHHQHYTDEGVPAKHSETCWLLVMWLSQCTLVLCHGLDLQASPAASAAVPLAMVALHWIHVSADICQRQPWYQIAACGLVPFVVHGVWGVASFTVLDADWAASTEAATAAPAQHRNDAAFQLWTFSYVIAAGFSMALSMGAYVNEKTARQDFLGVEEQRAAVDRAVQHEDVDATVTSDEGDIADRRELHGWQLHLPRHSWESAYWERTVPRVLSYRAERQRRLDFLADQSSKLTAQPDGTNLGSTNADELIQSPLLLCFLSRPLELRFCAHKHEQYLSSSALSSGGVITLAVLHAAASAATLAHHQHYTDEGVPAKHSETCWLLVMWLSQCTLVLCHGLDLQASPAASAAVPLAMVALHWIHVSADICQRQPWYQIAACGLVPFVVHGVWGVASFTVLDADWAASTEAATAAPAQHRNDAAFQLWTFSYVIAAGISMALSMDAYVNEETARQDFLGVEEQRAAVDRAVQHEDVDATVTSDEGDIADRRELHGWQLHLPRHSWESAYWEQTVPRGVRAWWTHARIVAFVTTGLLLVAESTRGAAPQMFAYNGIALALSGAAAHTAWIPQHWTPVVSLFVNCIMMPGLCCMLISHLETGALRTYIAVMHQLLLLARSRGPAVGAMLSWTCKAVWGMLGTIALWYAEYQSSLAHNHQDTQYSGISSQCSFDMILIMVPLLDAALSYRSEHKNKLTFLHLQYASDCQQSLFVQYLTELHNTVPGVVIAFEVHFLKSGEVLISFTYASLRCLELLHVCSAELRSNIGSFLSHLPDGHGMPSGFHQTVAAAAASELPINWLGIIKPEPDQELKWINLTASCVSADLASKRSRKIVKYTGMFTDYTERKHLGHLQKQRTIRLSDNHLFHAVKNNFVGAYHCAEQIRKSIQQNVSSLPHHSLDPMIKHAHLLTLIALRGQSDCHSRAMLNNVFEGLYVSEKSSFRFAAVLEDIAVSRLGSLLECHVASDAKDVVTLIDLRMCTAMLVCLFTHILTEASCDSVALKPAVYLNIVGTDVRVDIKHSVKRPVSKTASLPLSQSTLLQDADNMMPNLQLTPLQPSPAIAAMDANQMSTLAVKERSRIDVCRQYIDLLGWELNVGVITTSNMDGIMCYSVTMPDVVHHEPCIVPQNSTAAEQSSPPTQSGVLLQSWVKIAALDDCPISRLLLKRSLVVKLHAQEVWVSGNTYEEILNFPKRVMKSGIHIVILDQWLSQALPPNMSEIVTGNSVMEDLRRMGFKGMIILRSGDVQKDDDKEETSVRVGFNAIIGKNGDCAETICTKWHHWYNSTKATQQSESGF